MDDLQVMIKQIVDIEPKTACQAPLLIQQSEAHCFCNHVLPKHEKSKYQKSFTAKN